jgi:hypothetical protein
MGRQQAWCKEARIGGVWTVCRSGIDGQLCSDHLSLVLVLVVDSADAFAVHRSPFRPRACQNPFCRSSLCALCGSVVNPSPSVASGTSSEIFSMQAPSEAQIAATNVRLHRMYRAAQRYLFRLSLRYSYRPGVTSACRHNILAA